MVEGAVIVVSILLAFGIDAAWDERGERRSERLALEALYAEAIANRELIEGVINRVNSDIATTSEFYDLPITELQSVPQNFQSSQVLQSLWRPNTYSLKEGALEGLLRSGRLELVRNRVLSRQLVDWQSEASDLDERHRVLASLELEIMTAIGRHEEVQPWLATRGVPGEARVSTGGSDLSRFPTNLRPIREDPDVMGPVATMQFQRRVYIMILEQLIGSLDGLIEELARELE